MRHDDLALGRYLLVEARGVGTDGALLAPRVGALVGGHGAPIDHLCGTHGIDDMETVRRDTRSGVVPQPHAQHGQKLQRAHDAHEILAADGAAVQVEVRHLVRAHLPSAVQEARCAPCVGVERRRVVLAVNRLERRQQRTKVCRVRLGMPRPARRAAADAQDAQ